jgi:glycerol uptake facilitator-like aquaporin
MGERLSNGNAALALLANALATGSGLYVLITTLEPISGAHFNPVVSVVMALRGDLSLQAVPAYIVAQFAGALLGVMAAHAMFDLPLLQISEHMRAGSAQMFSELTATVGLLGTILLVSRQQPSRVATAVACYIVAAYWFTASTSFANPAVSVARALTNTFAGIRPTDVAGFVAAQILATLLCAVLAWHQRKTAITSPRSAAQL